MWGVSLFDNLNAQCVSLSFKALLKTAEATRFSNSCLSFFLLPEMDPLQTEVTSRGLILAKPFPSPPKACSVKLSTVQCQRPANGTLSTSLFLSV